MIDTLIRYKEKALKSKIKEKLDLKDYALLTLHRPENVDRKENLETILSAIKELQKAIKVICPIHPRTEKMIEGFGLQKRIEQMLNLIIVPPMSYIDFLRLEMEAKFVLTDSGGIQEETTFLGILCLTWRNNTERPVTVEMGTNIVVNDSQGMIKESLRILKGKGKKGKVPPLWDGKTSERIVEVIRNRE